MNRFLPTRGRARALAATAGLVLAPLAVLTVGTATPAHAEVTTIDAGTVTWGVRTSWRNYAGPGTVSEGLTRNDAGEYVWQVESGSYDSDTKRLELQTSGSVHWDLHEGALDVTLSDLRLVVDGDEPQIWADVQSKSMETGQTVDYGDIALADVELDGTAYSAAGGTSTWAPQQTQLTQAGVPVFAGFYGNGALFDPVSASYTGPGGVPVATAEQLYGSGEIIYSRDLAVSTDLVSDPTVMLADVPRNVVHVGNGTSLRPYDATTLLPLAPAQAVGFTASYPAPTYDQSAMALVGNSGGNLVAARWNPTTLGYDVTQLATGTVSQLAYNRTSATVWALSSGTVRRIKWNGTAYDVTSFPVSGTLDLGRPGFAADALGRLVVVSASDVPKALTLTDGTYVVSTIAGDFTNPTAQQSFYQYPTEAMSVTSTRILLTNYQGQVFTITYANGAYARSGDKVETGLSQVLRSYADPTSQLWSLVDWGAMSVSTVRGTSVGKVSQPNLGWSVLSPIATSLSSSKIFALAARQGAAADTYGLYRWTETAVAPVVVTQPTAPVVSLPTGTTSATATMTAASSAPAMRWQTRAPGVTSVRGWTDIPDATGSEVTVDLAEADQGRQYRALFTSTVGTVASRTVLADVKTQPAVIVQPTDVDTLVGDDAVVQVMPKGNPYPAITWQRRVGGYWQDIASDDNLTVDGGTLTVLDTNADQNGSLFRARLDNEVGSTWTRSSRLTVSEPSTAPRVVDSGALSWGVKQSFRTYVEGPIAHGTITVADGATRGGDGTFSFPVDAGTFDPESGALEVAYDGSVHFSGHDGQLELEVSDLRVDLTGDTGTLVADMTSRSLESGQVDVFDDVTVATLDAADGLTVGGTSVVLAGVGATLTAAGAPAFGGFYQEGTALDDLGGSHGLGAEVPAAPEPTLTVSTSRTSYAFGGAGTIRVVGTDVDGPVTVTAAGTTRQVTLAGGTATVALPRTATPGRYAVRASAAGVTATASYAVTKATPRLRVVVPAKGAPRLRVVTSLPQAPARTWATGRLVVREGARVVAVGRLTAAGRGVVVVPLRGLSAGRHWVEVTYAGSSTTLPVTSAPKAVRVRR